MPCSIFSLVYFILFHFISFYFILFHLTPQHPTSPHLTSLHFTSLSHCLQNIFFNVRCIVCIVLFPGIHYYKTNIYFFVPVALELTLRWACCEKQYNKQMYPWVPLFFANVFVEENGGAYLCLSSNMAAITWSCKACTCIIKYRF